MLVFLAVAAAALPQSQAGKYDVHRQLMALEGQLEAIDTELHAPKMERNYNDCKMACQEAAAYKYEHKGIYYGKYIKAYEGAKPLCETLCGYYGPKLLDDLTSARDKL